MDTVTAIGLVSGIIIFINTAIKFLKLVQTLYNLVEGSSKEIEIRLILANYIATILKRLILMYPNPTLTEEDKAIAMLA